MNQIFLKCRQCRKELLQTSASPILTGHNLVITAESIHYPCPDTDCRDMVDSFYLEEDGLPEWLLLTVKEVFIFFIG